MLSVCVSLEYAVLRLPQRFVGTVVDYINSCFLAETQCEYNIPRNCPIPMAIYLSLLV